MKSVLVIDEAQDIDENEFALIRALIHTNDDMRVIAVGDDDQNIYEFRGSNSKYMRALIDDYGAVKYEMGENFRSKRNIVALSNTFIGSLHNRMKLSLIQSVQDGTGTVEIISHISDHMEEAVADHIVKAYQGGKACVLTNTNYEALQVLGLLSRKGIRAKLIQSNDGFNLYNLAEVRFFMKLIDSKLNSPVIDDNLWIFAKEQLAQVYVESSCLTNCLNMLTEFEFVNRIKYRTDLDEFIKESNYEDFYSDENEVVYVSTIHKSKGREFDSVYLLLKNIFATNDEEKRKLYVGMTRAKESLYIHCNTNILSQYSVEGVVKTEDATEYEEPSEISLQLTYKDVVLNFFKDKKEFILGLRSGRKLAISDNYLVAELNGRTVYVAKFSKAFKEKLENLDNKGYKPYCAFIGYVLAWHGENDDGESAIILPILHFKQSFITE